MSEEKPVGETPTEEVSNETKDEVSKINGIEETIEKLAEELAPPEQNRRNFTVICGCLLKTRDVGFPHDVAAVHIKATDVDSAREGAKQLLGENVPDTEAKDWEPMITYVGLQEAF